MRNRKIGREPDRKMNRTKRKKSGTTREELRTLDGLSRKDVENGINITLEPVKSETREAQKEGPIILTGLKLEAEDGSGRSLELARCLDQHGYGAFFVDHGASRQTSRTAYCPHCQRRHYALRLIDAVDEGWDVLGEDQNDCCLSAVTVISGVIQLLRKKAAPAKAATS